MSKEYNGGTSGTLEHRKVHDLVLNPRNARTHSAAQISKIAESIREFKFLNPVIIDQNNVVIAGHGRIEAAKKLGLETVPVLLYDHLSDAQKRAFMLADNRIAADAGRDESILKIEISELIEIGEFDLAITGFDENELSIFSSQHEESNESENDIPDEPVSPVSRLGDVWLLGEHRVRCGDSTNQADVAAVLLNSKPHLMVTDPPYGVEYDADWRNHTGMARSARATGKVLNDGQADWRGAWALFPGDVAYIWHAGRRASEVQQSIESVGFEIRCQIIWSKNVFAIGRGDYHWKHEPCWYAVKKGAKTRWNGSRKETTVWDINKPQKSETGHSTQKPVECMRRPILNNSKHGDVVYDPFLGSGTTIIAAETEGRICYGLELNPAYVDVIVRRWQEFTGKQGILESSGQAFDDIKERID